MQPLADAEIEELNAFLLSDACPETAMDISMLDGFLAALVSGPNRVMPSAMLCWIWDAEEGEASPEIASTTEANKILGYIMRHWNSVIEALSDDSKPYAPIVLESTTEGRTISVIDDWCLGYYKGIALDLAAWEPLMSTRPEWFSVILRHASQIDSVEWEHPSDDLDQQQANVDSLGISAMEIYRYWLPLRTRQMVHGEMSGNAHPREPIRRGEKIGRNDPCPCGSGKKFKRCHGADESWENTPAPTRPVDEALKELSTDEEAVDLVRSPLCQRLTREGHTVDIEIYGDGEGGWLLEVVDDSGIPTVWDESFATDAAALEEVLHTIDTEGIAAVIGPAPPEETRD